MAPCTLFSILVFIARRGFLVHPFTHFYLPRAPTIVLILSLFLSHILSPSLSLIVVAQPQCHAQVLRIFPNCLFPKSQKGQKKAYLTISPSFSVLSVSHNTHTHSLTPSISLLQSHLHFHLFFSQSPFPSIHLFFLLIQ